MAAQLGLFSKLLCTSIEKNIYLANSDECLRHIAIESIWQIVDLRHYRIYQICFITHATEEKIAAGRITVGIDIDLR
jgi:hypothetical protein